MANLRNKNFIENLVSDWLIGLSSSDLRPQEIRFEENEILSNFNSPEKFFKVINSLEN